jgi:ubiquinone/menaquinone biosynthesis C-methylase UbiE
VQRLNSMNDAKIAATNFEAVTELAGEPISAEQLDRMYNRYSWAARLTQGKDVVEVACGSGPGLGLIARHARSLVAGDYSKVILERARRHYGQRIALTEFDATAMPFADRSKDAVLIFEAIYYLPDPARFAAECRRILRPGGGVLIATANKDLSDFNPSPHSHQYFGARELGALFRGQGFSTEVFGYLAVDAVSWRQRVLRPVRKLAVALGLMPKTMAGKQLLKRLVFGKPVLMPAELTAEMGTYVEPTRLADDQPDTRHKVLYCVARLPS